MGNAETVVREFCRAWSRLDPEELTGYFTDDAVYHNMPLAPLEGKDAIRAFLTGFLAGATSAEFRIGHLVADGDVVLTERVDAFSIGGREIAVPVMGTFELRDGKIGAWRDYFDMAAVTAFLSGS
jgi:limonene-1,2-epoxide hydrolase